MLCEKLSDKCWAWVIGFKMLVCFIQEVGNNVSSFGNISDGALLICLSVYEGLGKHQRKSSKTRSSAEHFDCSGNS